MVILYQNKYLEERKSSKALQKRVWHLEAIAGSLQHVDGEDEPGASEHDHL